MVDVKIAYQKTFVQNAFILYDLSSILHTLFGWVKERHSGWRTFHRKKKNLRIEGIKTSLLVVILYSYSLTVRLDWFNCFKQNFIKIYRILWIGDHVPTTDFRIIKFLSRSVLESSCSEIFRISKEISKETWWSSFLLLLHTLLRYFTKKEQHNVSWDIGKFAHYNMQTTAKRIINFAMKRLIT